MQDGKGIFLQFLNASETLLLCFLSFSQLWTLLNIQYAF